ncbi:hypothetical protein Tco_0434497 [Tanacetum coccineum]
MVIGDQQQPMIPSALPVPRLSVAMFLGHRNYESALYIVAALKLIIGQELAMAADVRVKDINEIYAQAKFLEVTNGYSLSSNIPNEPTVDEFDNDNIIGKVTNDAQDLVDNQTSDYVDNYEALVVESTVDVEDYDNFIVDEAEVDEIVHDEYTHHEATDDNFDI